MRANRITIALICALVASAAVAAAALAQTAIAIYSNNMESVAKRSQVVKLSGSNCNRGGTSTALRVAVGRRTEECSYRTPVIGRDLEVFATARLLSGTPKALRKKIFVAANLRSGAGGRYQLAVFPLQRKFQIRKDFPNGTRQVIKVEKGVKRIRHKINQANKLRLRAFNLTSGPDKGSCRVLAFINDKRVAAITDPRGGEFEGRYSGFSVGSKRSASRAVASFDDIVVRVPTPF
jgi:hypothetical protein